MHNRFMNKAYAGERGFVSILTVLLFIVLLTVITVSFTRLMIQERRQALEDELTKSAFNSAQAGIEDAKRALLYCSTRSGADKSDCDNFLYTSECPGFNSTNYFSSIGIRRSVDGRTGLTSDSAVQGYSCVILKSRTGSLQGSLSQLSSSGALYELKTTSPFNRLRVAWHMVTDSTTFYSPNTFVKTYDANNIAAGAGNPRAVDTLPAGSGFLATSPSVLRLTVISVPSGNFNLTDPNPANMMIQRSYFVYPVGRAGAPTTITNVDNATQGSATDTRLETSCNTSFGDYSCAVDIAFSTPHTDRQFIMLHTIYKDTAYQITATGPGGAVDFDGVQTEIDSTGYASGLFRRVKTGVRLGGQTLSSANSIDSGSGFCKDFRIGSDASLYRDNAASISNCSPYYP